MRRWIWLATLIACPAAAKDALVIGVAQFPASMNPYISSQTVQYYAIGFGLRPDHRIRHGGQPDLPAVHRRADAGERPGAQVEDLRDGMQGLAVTIKLKPDLVWGDGVPVTARDVAFTWKLGSDPAAGFSEQLHLGTGALGRRGRRPHRRAAPRPARCVTYQLWDYLLPEHIEGPVAGRGQVAARLHQPHRLQRRADHAGAVERPLPHQRLHVRQRVELTPEPVLGRQEAGHQARGDAPVDNTAALQANLLSGDVDMTPSGIGITTDQAVALEKDHPGSSGSSTGPACRYERIDVQPSNNPLLADIRVRKALLLALDRKTLIDRLFSGHATLALSWINAVEPRYTTDVATYPYDPAQARALLREAGYTPGPDGVCRNAAGDRLSFEFATTSGNRIRELSQQVMQDWWNSEVAPISWTVCGLGSYVSASAVCVLAS